MNRDSADSHSWKICLINNLDVAIEVDGGINNKTGKLVSEAGADILVAGSYIFKHSDMNEAVSSLACL